MFRAPNIGGSWCLGAALVATIAGCAADGGNRSAPTPTATPTPTLTATATPSTTLTATPSTTPTPWPTATFTFPSSPTFTPIPPCDRLETICTVAGTGFAGFNGDGRTALETFLYFPLDIEFDRQGRPLILDWNNLRVRRIDLNGRVETIMGTDEEAPPINGALAKDTPLHHSSDIEFDSTGQLFVAGYHAPVVFRVGIDDRVLIVAGTDEFGSTGDGGPALEATFVTPYGITVASDGGYYVSDIAAHVVRRVDSSGMIHAFAGTGEPGYSGDGGAATAARLNGPARIQLDGGGNLLICDSNNNVIRRVDRDGMITTIAGNGEVGYSGDGGPATAARFNRPLDLRFAPNGDLYVADAGNNVIRRIDRNGIVTTVAGSGLPGFGGDGGPATSARLSRPSGINFASDGSLWIADTLNHRVRRVVVPLDARSKPPRS